MEWSVGPVILKIKTYYIGYREKGISCIPYNEGRLTELVVSYIGTAIYNTL
jgi:hypothetical protein